MLRWLRVCDNEGYIVYTADDRHVAPFWRKVTANVEFSTTDLHTA